MKTTLKYFINVTASAYIGLLIMCIAHFIVSFISYDDAVRSISSSVISDIGALIFLYISFTKWGYDDNKKDGKLIDGRTVVFMSRACGLYMLLTIIFQYYTAAATNVCAVATVMVGNPNLDIRYMALNHKGYMFLSLLIQTIPYIPAMMLGYIKGARKRVKSRCQLLQY